MWPVFIQKFHFGVLVHGAGDGESISLFLHPFPAQFWSSCMCLKAIIHSFQEHLSMCKCGQYSSRNSISEFWSMVQEMGNQSHYFYTHFLLNFGVLACV